MLLWFSALVLIFLVEHVGRLNGLIYRPSYFLTFVATWCQDFYHYCGKIFALISSFYDWLNFKEIYHSLQDLLIPIWNVITSPFYLLKGYGETMHTYRFPILIALGSLTIVVILLWLFKNYAPWSLINTYIDRMGTRFMTIQRS